jgi:hypothetical protein
LTSSNQLPLLIPHSNTEVNPLLILSAYLEDPSFTYVHKEALQAFSFSIFANKETLNKLHVLSTCCGKNISTVFPVMDGETFDHTKARIISTLNHAFMSAALAERDEVRLAGEEGTDEDIKRWWTYQ